MSLGNPSGYPRRAPGGRQPAALSSLGRELTSWEQRPQPAGLLPDQSTTCEKWDWCPSPAPSSPFLTSLWCKRSRGTTQDSIDPLSLSLTVFLISHKKTLHLTLAPFLNAPLHATQPLRGCVLAVFQQRSRWCEPGENAKPT